ncbi:4'-phosphopantetheinyl transferase AcpT [Salmonella enterica]|nr:4'-phosphopantetheinyl transferase AcpT [Salmonella enterica]EAS2028932.1 4'-phosphopantetheinyl transferase AcpT [Salmonella enterica]EAU0260419.1 4'-phosphopantetheinyl transferase AcpT [Salmonella enterica]EBQ3428153.1 4'-phosphopantetheinyl transferase AcpT [Salmonella enterica]
MLRVWSGSISQLSQTPLPSGLQMPVSPRASWHAGRVPLAHALFPSPLPELTIRQNGKPSFAGELGLWFNLSHSGDDIALAISDEGEVGCDIEVIRPRKNWRNVAVAVFSVAERQQLADTPEPEQLSAFWQIWTRKEAMLKQAAGQVWQMAKVDSAAPRHAVHQQLVDDRLWFAVCTETSISPEAPARAQFWYPTTIPGK